MTHLPILIIPGIMSSGLEVKKSAIGDKYVGTRVWINPVALGFSELYWGRALETVLNEDNPNNQLKRKGGKMEDEGSAEEDFSDEEEDEAFEVPKSTDKEQVKAALRCKSAWLHHLSLSDDMITERQGNEIRPIFGLDGVDFLTDFASIKVGASYVFGPVIKMLTSNGYTAGKDLDAATYDWRVPPSILEERDGYFTDTLDRIERMYEDCGGIPVVLLCHSMGSKVGHYLLTFAKVHRGREWVDKYIHTYMPVGGPHIGAPSTIATAFHAALNPLLDPMLRNEERLIFGRSLGSAPWLMPRYLPSNVAALPTVFSKQEGLLEISINSPIGDCDKLIRTRYGTRDMDSLKLFLCYGGKEARSKAAKRQEHEDKNAKYYQFQESFLFPTPPTLDDGGLQSLELILKEQGNMRAYEKEKCHPLVVGLRLLDKDRAGRLLADQVGKTAKSYRTVIARSTKQTINAKALLSSIGYEMDISVTIHARVDMSLRSMTPKKDSRHIETTVHVKWTPPPSSSLRSSAPLAELPASNSGSPFASAPSIKSEIDSSAEYKPLSGNTILQAEGLEDSITKLVETKYETDAIGPRTTSAVDAPPVKKVCSIYGINLPTAVSAVCCRAPHVVKSHGKVTSRFIMDKAARFLEETDAKGYELVDGQINETRGTPQKDLLSGDIVHKSGDGTVPYYSLQQCQVWKKNNPECEVHIEEIDGAEHRAILNLKQFHDILLNYVSESEKN